MSYMEYMDEIIKSGKSSEEKIKIVDLKKEKDIVKISNEFKNNRVIDNPVVIFSNKEDYAYDLIKRHSYSYIELEKSFVAYHNMDLPKCEGCLENKFNPKQGILDLVVE